MSLCFALNNIDSKSTEIEIADFIHQGWVINYNYWRDHKPWEKEVCRNKPAKPLNDERRNLCAETKFSDLPNDEKEKDLLLAKWIQKKFFK